MWKNFIYALDAILKIVKAVDSGNNWHRAGAVFLVIVMIACVCGAKYFLFDFEASRITTIDSKLHFRPINVMVNTKDGCFIYRKIGKNLTKIGECGFLE